jgi:hypothetical protein
LNFLAVRADRNEDSSYFDEATQMLAEKFLLLLETLRSQRHEDGAPRVVSTSPHVPVKVGGQKQG